MMMLIAVVEVMTIWFVAVQVLLLLVNLQVIAGELVQAKLRAGERLELTR